MRPLALSLLLVGLAAAKAGPDAASRARIVPSALREAVLTEKPTCPVTWDLALTIEMPNPGWKLACDEVTAPDGDRRRIVRLTATPTEGLWPAVMTPTTVKVPLGPMEKGVDLLDVQQRNGAGAPYQRLGALLVRGE